MELALLYFVLVETLPGSESDLRGKHGEILGLVSTGSRFVLGEENLVGAALSNMAYNAWSDR